jgi:Mg-chelatase subunit ChlD
MDTNSAIVIGSLTAIARQENKSLAQAFVNCEAICIVDTSGSMSSNDSRGGNSRYNVACQELATLQSNRPGKIAVISFSDEAQFCPSGIPYYFGSNTNVARALQLALVADVPGIQIILISDGEPDDEARALEVAKAYKNSINVIYVGPEARPAGRNFLERLAHASGGRLITADCAKELKSGVEQFLLESPK